MAKLSQAQDNDRTRPVPSGGRPPTARKKLIAAAYKVMGGVGLEGSTVTAIIEQAGVGAGSFYNHFTSKEDLARAVFASKVDEFGATLEHVVVQSSDAAVATCFAYRRLIEEAERDKLWAAFIVQLEPSMQMLDRLLRKYARPALQLFVDRKQLKIHNVEVGITAIHAMEIAMVKAMLDGTVTPKEAHGSVVFALRMFGVPDDEATRLSRLSMTALRRELRASQGTTAD
ncbi:MAG: hypothetical protein JWO15_1537 [Sphingomonadales bacterium]|nr:hypothetical protein [Sphingomonadales bacterium]